MKALITLISTIWILGDLLYGLIRNTAEVLHTNQTIPSPNFLSITESAFSWLQITVSSGMILLTLSALASLWKLQRSNSERIIWRFTPMRLASILLLIAFTAPTTWLWLFTLFNLFQGHFTPSLTPINYLISAFCQPILLVLCMDALWQRHKLSKQWIQQNQIQQQTTTIPPKTVYIPPQHPWHRP